MKLYRIYFKNQPVSPSPNLVYDDIQNAHAGRLMMEAEDPLRFDGKLEIREQKEPK